VLVASALVSISLNPLLFKASDWVEARLRYRAKLWGLLSDRAEERGREMNTETAAKLARMEPDKVRAVVVGYGPVGKTLTGILKGFGIHPVIVDLNIDNVARLSEEGFSAIYGDAGNSDILKAAGVDRAKYLAITLPDLLGRIPVIVAARELNENLIILSRARYLAERATLEEFGVTEVCYEEAEAAVGLSECLLRAEGAEEQKISEESRRIRLEFALKKQE
jgi:CPA2 family monovalent cation:H+ antiporter-2